MKKSGTSKNIMSSEDNVFPPECKEKATEKHHKNNTSVASMNDIIKVNVGGEKFETTRQTLLHDPGSMLAKMFDPVSPLSPGVMRDGAYFLDRCPVSFRLVLNYLRSGQLTLDRQANLEALKIEASYFGLASLEESIVERLKEEEGRCQEEKIREQTRTGDEFLINVGGEVFVTTKETLCKYSGSRLANMVEGKCRQQFDKDGILFLDEDAKDFAYILRALRNSPNVPTAVPKEHIDNILNLRDNLEIREIKFGYREQSNSFVSEYFLSVCR